MLISRITRIVGIATVQCVLLIVGATALLLVIGESIIADDEQQDDIENITVTAPRLECPIGAVCYRGVIRFSISFPYTDGAAGGGGGGSPKVEKGPNSIDCWSQLTGKPNAPITGKFGESRSSEPHKGLDIGVPTGTPVYAARDGIVHSVRNDLPDGSELNQSGNFVRVNLDGGDSARFLHLKHGSVTVSSGDRVTAGQKLGESNATGQRLTGPHLHYDQNTKHTSRMNTKAKATT